MKFFLASFNRASSGAISKLKQRLIKENMHTYIYQNADYIIAVGDRSETFDFVLERYREGYPIIHLWAGEISQGTHDEVYRHSMTLMSDVQLCTNNDALITVHNLCKSVGKSAKAYMVGNVMLDNMDNIDESKVPMYKYDLVLYNPPTLCNTEEIEKELHGIDNMADPSHRIWISPNGDKYSDLVSPYVTHDNLPREQFLGLVKNCRRYITNSSSAYYEAPFLMSVEDIVIVGERNKKRNSINGMDQEDASKNIMLVLRDLDEEQKVQRMEETRDR